MTIPIAPIRETTETTPTRYPSAPPLKRIDTNPANGKVFVSIPMHPPARRWPLVAAASLLLSISAYFFSGRQDNSKSLSSAATKIDVPIPSPSPVQTGAVGARTKADSAPADSSFLTQARSLEARERYPEAIQKYEEYLRRNPNAADAALISGYLATLRQFQGLMTAGSTALENGRFAEARQNLAEALRLRPESQLAKSGLARCEAEEK